MLLTLLLALGASDVEWIDRIVWGLALGSWPPQLLVAWVVLRKPRPLLTQLLLLLSPLLLVATVGYWPAGLLLMAIYSDPQFMLWLPLALLPTFGAMSLAVARRKAPQQAGSSTGNWGWGLAVGGSGMLLATGAGWWLRPDPQDWAVRKEPAVAEVQPTRMELRMDSLYTKERQNWEEQDRQAQLREDSLRSIEPDPAPAPQRW